MVRKYISDILNENSLSAIFHENTKITGAGSGIGLNISEEIIKKIHYKRYPRTKKIKLPKNFKINKSTFEETIKKRKSHREFVDTPLELAELSYLLFNSAGLLNEKHRAYPSAGAKYPLEIYPVVFNCKKVEKGVYHYDVKSHELELLQSGDFKEEMIRWVNDQNWIKNSSVIFLISAIFGRTKIKYGERGYRYIFLDAGHLTQNFYLVSATLGLGCCSIGGFMDDKLNNLVDLDGIRESMIYLVVIGKI